MQFLIYITSIKYFDKIFGNPNAHRAIFVSDDNKLYGCGQNNAHQMGWNDDQIESYKSDPDTDDDNSKYNNYEPALIPHPCPGQIIKDIQGASRYTIALCENDNEQSLIIITNWCRIYHVAADILQLLVLFCKQSVIYSTTNEAGSGHPKNAELANKYGWNEIKAFENINITKIAVGDDKTLFLDDTGNVWYCGQTNSENYDEMNEDYEDKGLVYIPRMIEHFKKNKIKIIDIDCSAYCNLALSEEGKVYSWGNIALGIGDADVKIPRLIESLNEFVVNGIKCGDGHCVIKTRCGKYFTCGKNNYGECFGSLPDGLYIPFRVDVIIAEKYGIKSIIDIVPGYYDTIVLAVS